MEPSFARHGVRASRRRSRSVSFHSPPCVCDGVRRVRRSVSRVGERRRGETRAKNPANRQKRKRLRGSCSPPPRFDGGDRAPTSSRAVCIIRRGLDPGRDSHPSLACTLRVAILTAFARRGSGRRPRLTRQQTDFRRRRTARPAVGFGALVLSAPLRDAILPSLVRARLPRLRDPRGASVLLSPRADPFPNLAGSGRRADAFVRLRAVRLQRRSSASSALSSSTVMSPVCPRCASFGRAGRSPCSSRCPEASSSFHKPTLFGRGRRSLSS